MIYYIEGKLSVEFLQKDSSTDFEKVQKVFFFLLLCAYRFLSIQCQSSSKPSPCHPDITCMA